MSNSNSDKGLILTKKDFVKDDKLIILFCEGLGRISIIAKGIKSVTSKRLSHLETGNYIQFSYTNSHNYFYLQETEITYGYSKIKENSLKIKHLYKILFILNQLLPDHQPEDQIFRRTLMYLKLLNNKEECMEDDLHQYLKDILILGGYINSPQSNDEYFNPTHFLEELIQKRITIPTF